MADNIVASDWWRTFFDLEYLRLWTPYLTPERTRQETAGLIHLLQLTPETPVLDLACGDGRIARSLAAHGIPVTGVDISPSLLTEAQRQSDPAMPVEWAQEDMRLVSRRWPGRFAAIICMFNSLGYFAHPIENRCVIRELALCLQPGGKALLQLTNRDGVRPSSKGWFRVNGTVISEQHHFNPCSGRIESQMQWQDGATVKTRTYSVYIYTPTELSHLATDYGLRVVGIYRDFDQHPIRPDDLTMLAVLTRPKV